MFKIDDGKIILVAFIICATYNPLIPTEAKRLRTKTCRQEECQLSPQHFALYSSIKEAVESKFDLKGKQIYPLLNSIEVLRRRYNSNDPTLKATSKLIKELLDNDYLVRSLKTLDSVQGRALIDLYRGSVNGHQQNLACNRLRIQDIERASKQLDSDADLKAVFGKVHENYVKKSAKKCLRRACNSIDTTMSRLDYMLTRPHGRPSEDDLENSITDSVVERTNSSKSERPTYRREFETQELELCRFLKKTNKTECEITGPELKELSFIGPNGLKLADLIDAYYLGKQIAGDDLVKRLPENSNSDATFVSRSQLILDQCRPMRSLLDHNLAALRWYNRGDLIDKQKFATHSSWCPKLSYWLQVDRLCSELEMLITKRSSVKTETGNTELEREGDLKPSS